MPKLIKHYVGYSADMTIDRTQDSRRTGNWQAREERDYVPPEAPTYTARIGTPWSSSMLALRDFGQNASVAIVFASPWLVILTMILISGVYWIRRRRPSGVIVKAGAGPPA